LGLLDFFKKRSEEEEFQEAVEEQDYIRIANLGKKLLEKYPDTPSILNPFVDALVKLGKKEEAVEELLNFAERKVKDEYYEMAIPVLKKALKIDPLNMKAVRYLVNTYKKKGLYYDAFKTLAESFTRFKEAGLDAEKIGDLLESFIQEQFHPLFYEKYGDLLMAEGDAERALINFVMAANLYINLKNYKSALRSLLKAKKIRKNENIDAQLIDVAAKLDPKTATPVVLSLLNTYADPEFIKLAVDAFRESGKLPVLKKIAEGIKNPKVKYALLALVNYELGEVEEGEEYLEKLKLTDREMYEKVLLTVKTRHSSVAPALDEEIPEPEQVIEVLDQVFDQDEMLDLGELVTEFIDSIDLEPETENIEEEIVSLKEMEKDGRKYTSTAEAMLGLGKYDEAIEAAKKALNTDQAGKAAILIGEALRLKGDYKQALSFLLDQIQNSNLSEEDRARLKVLVGEIYEEKGNSEKALYWYRAANRVLKDPEIEEKINQLTANERV